MVTRRPVARPYPMRALLERCHLTYAQAADRLGVGPRQIARWNSINLTHRQADRLAVKLGRHPTEIWNWEPEHPTEERT